MIILYRTTKVKVFRQSSRTSSQKMIKQRAKIAASSRKAKNTGVSTNAIPHLPHPLMIRYVFGYFFDAASCLPSRPTVSSTGMANTMPCACVDVPMV